jgi:hypothetical protein
MGRHHTTAGGGGAILGAGGTGAGFRCAALRGAGIAGGGGARRVAVFTGGGNAAGACCTGRGECAGLGRADRGANFVGGGKCRCWLMPRTRPRKVPARFNGERATPYTTNCTHRHFNSQRDARSASSLAGASGRAATAKARAERAMLVRERDHSAVPIFPLRGPWRACATTFFISVGSAWRGRSSRCTHWPPAL